jgi:hypothetical protein
MRSTAVGAAGRAGERPDCQTGRSPRTRKTSPRLYKEIAAVRKISDDRSK